MANYSNLQYIKKLNLLQYEKLHKFIYSYTVNLIIFGKKHFGAQRFDKND